MNATRKQIEALADAAKGTDAWLAGYAAEALRVRAAEAKDWRERQLASLMLRKLGE